MLSNIKNLVNQTGDTFNIIEEFSSISSKRKMLLCDHLFIEGHETFAKTVRLLWAEATPRDIKKLERFLYLMKKAAH